MTEEEACQEADYGTLADFEPETVKERLETAAGFVGEMERLVSNQ